MWSTTEFWAKFGMPAPEKEYRFDAVRHWRTDYCWPDVKLAVEKEGAIWKIGKDGKQGGRHNRPKGFINDIEKYNAMVEQGWSLLRYVTGKFDYDQIARVYINLRKSKL